MKLKNWLLEHGADDNILAPPMDAGEAASILSDELLDGAVLANYPASGNQALTEAVCAVVERYGKKKLARTWLGEIMSKLFEKRQVLHVSGE